MKAKVIKAFKDASKGVRYEVGQETDIDVKDIDKFESLGFVSRLEEASEPKKAPRTKKVKE